MYYMKLKDINEAFSHNFISPPFIWGITAVYLGLVLLANTIARYNAPYILTVPERIWPCVLPTVSNTLRILLIQL